jgi:hypothetical protein
LIVTEMPRLAEGGLKVISDWIEAAECPRLVIIDTLAMVRMPNRKDQSSYDADYSAVVDLRTLAQKDGIAIVLVPTRGKPLKGLKNKPSKETVMLLL